MKRKSLIFCSIIVTLFASIAIVFDTFPRTSYSELEKRELASFPEFSWEKLASGQYTKEISSWYSDSQPYRDSFMALSMYIDDAMRLVTSEDNITIHITDSGSEGAEQEEIPAGDDRVIDEYQNNLTANENAKIANAGIIIVGSGENVRALMMYGGDEKGGKRYAEAANIYKETFGKSVNVYSMTIPTSTEFYCPEKVKNRVKPQRPTINNIHSLLNKDVVAVDAYSSLAKHAAEDIYLRTDHHWAPLGAYYAAEAFAKKAGVPFKDLSAYSEDTVKRFVGSMYGYSKDIAVKNAPENFIYHKPLHVKYTTTFTNYRVDKSYHVTGVQKPYQGEYFAKFKDGSSSAYLTFMGGDMKITHVKTDTKNGRKLMIIKDSFGNAIPGYLFYSFEELFVVDVRYFTKNMRSFVVDNGITDILFAFNVFNAFSANFANKAISYLSQADGTLYTPTLADEKKSTNPAKVPTDTKDSKPEPSEAPKTPTSDTKATAPTAPTEAPKSAPTTAAPADSLSRR